MKKLLFILLMGGLLGTSHLNGQVVLQALDAPDAVPSVPPFIPPTGVTMKNGERLLTSLYDDNYLPFTMPNSPASWVRPEDPDTIKERLIDYQGKITTEGIDVYIPLEIPAGTSVLPAYYQQITIPADRIENGTSSQDIALEWGRQTFSPYGGGSTYIKAKVKAIGSDLNIRKLDLNSGLGNDFKGVLLGTFTYKQSSTSSAESKFEIRVVSGIPDKNFNVQTTIDGIAAYRHEFLYLPMVAHDGTIWLNNNLGAGYSNLRSEHFDLAQQANAMDKPHPSMDYKAYGSLFQWGRPADGHELMTWTAHNQGERTYKSFDLQYHKSVCLGQPGVYCETPENPCPDGFHIPSFYEFIELMYPKGYTGPKEWTMRDSYHYANHTLGLPASGTRGEDGNWYPAPYQDQHREIAVWTKSINSYDESRPNIFHIDQNSTSIEDLHTSRWAGIGIRCVKDNSYPNP